jgi:uncharacterized phage-associated protein
MYNALKVLYFADKDHLGRYGRLIYGDSYVAMRHGPVPSAAYDIIKCARGDGICPAQVPAQELLSVSAAHQITPLREADLRTLSESEVECLDAAIERYGQLPFGELQRLCHADKAFQQSGENDFMPIEAIAASLPDTDDLLDYLRNG